MKPDIAGLEAEVMERAARSPSLWPDLEAICALGGRFAGSKSEGEAQVYLSRRLEEASGAKVVPHPVEYSGWRRGEAASVEILESGLGALPCVPLVRSPATPPEGLIAEVVDLGRGEGGDFQRRAADIAGRIALVRHEYMFATGTVHRRRKYQWAQENGAAGFLIANTQSGNLPVTGSSGAEPGHGIPAAGLSAESAARITASAGPYPRVRLRMDVEEVQGHTANLIAELPGRGPEWVVLCAHLDGHHLAQSAMDNGTGLASVLAVCEALAPHMKLMERGLRVAFFTVEEWALKGSQVYVEGLNSGQQSKIQLVLNLDSVAGSPLLTALTSEFPKVEGFLMKTARDLGVELGIHRPLMANSDHYNFACRGIPALRLVAGFNEPDSNLKYVLTPEDTLDKVAPGDLSAATRFVAALAFRACAAPRLTLRDSDN